MISPRISILPDSFLPRNDNLIRGRIYDFDINNIDHYNDIPYEERFDDNNIENDLNLEINNNSNSLESLLSTPHITNSNNDRQDERFSLIDFQRKQINNLKEDLIHYYSSPESLSHFKNNLEGEIIYDFYKDLDCENFKVAQNERFKRILSIINSDSEIQKKKSKLSNFNDSFSLKASIIKDNIGTKKKLKNANIIGAKMDEGSFLFSQEEDDQNKIMEYLSELKGIFILNSIDMESLGLIQFNFIENNLIFILRLIENKLKAKNNSKSLTTYINICLDILQCFKSTKLLFFILKFLKQNKDILDSSELNLKKEMIQFIPNNCFDFKELNNNINNNILISNLNEPLSKHFNNQNILNIIQLNFEDMITLNYENFLLLFINSKNNSGTKFKESYFYYKIDLTNKKIIDIRKICLLKEEDEKNENENILDVNISIKKDIIYFFYIVEKSDSYYLKYKLFNKYSMNLVKEGDIDLNNFVPRNLYNDYKFIYCTSYGNNILMIKKNSKLDYKSYIKCSFRIFEKDLFSYKEISDLSNFEMYNSLYLNNNLLILINKIDKKRFIAKLSIQKADNCVLNLFEIKKQFEGGWGSIKIAYNNRRFIITKVVRNQLYFNMTFTNYNNLIDKGISLLPFNSNIYDNNNPCDLYEYLIKEYSLFLNLCGNFELLNAEKEKNLIKYPFSFCCNFDSNNLDFIINNIFEDYNNNDIKLYYIIILKQMICSLYNLEIFKEDVVKRLILSFKKLILNLIESKNKKLLNKVLNEIMEISSYFKNNTIIEFDEIKNILDEKFKNISIDSKFLLIDFLLRQNQINKPLDFFKYIILLEKNYLMDIFKTKTFNLSNYYLLKKLMINASELLFKSIKNNNKELISLTSCLIENIQILTELVQRKDKNEENKYLENFYFLYNSFIFRTFFLLIEYLLTNKIFLNKKEIITALYKTVLIMDKYDININDIFDMNNMIEITNYSSYQEEQDNNSNNRNYISKFKINFKIPMDIVIKTNLLSYEEIRQQEKTIVIKIQPGEREIKFPFRKEQIYHNVKHINVVLKTLRADRNQKNFIINIIPLKNEKLYISYKNNMDQKIISLIEKCIIYYLLFLFENIKNELEKYNNDIFKEYRKIFQLEIFKILSFSENNFIKINNISLSEFEQKTNDLLKKINDIFGDIEDFSKLNTYLNINFNNINKELVQNKNTLHPEHTNIMKNNYSNDKRIKLSNINKYNKLFEIFNYDLPKNHLYFFQTNKNDDLNLLINTIFLFGVKYYNCFEKLKILMKEVEKMKIKDKEGIKQNINKIKLLDNYPLFYSFYEESFKMKNIYNKHRNEFKDSSFDEVNKKYFESIFEKLNFLYDRIIPCDDHIKKPNTLIIKNLLELIDNSNIGINEIILNAQIQNINTQIKLIELLIINNLLSYINNESNIILILNFISSKIRHRYIKLNSIFDNIYGADYFRVEELKEQFHLLLQILCDKNTSKNNNYSIIGKISLTESLIWKIKRRNFPIIIEMMKVFEEIKSEKQIDNNAIISVKNNIYNVKYFNNKKNLECKFEVFKILVYQILKIFIDILKYKEEKENVLSLENNPSKVLDVDFDDVFEKVMSFFIDINPNCKYYDDIILFFYKTFIISDILLNHILHKHPKIVHKIMEISLHNDIINDDNDNIKRINTKLIMLKLLGRIVENIKEDNLENELFFEKFKCINSTSLSYLFELLINKLNDNPEMEIIIKKYYRNLALICLNKVFELSKYNDITGNLIINNKNMINLLLLNNNSAITSEDEFTFKIDNSNNFGKYISLFNSEINNSIKTGKIICFVKDRLLKYINSDFDRIKHMNSFIKLDKFPSLYDSKNLNGRYNNALIIMKDSEQSDFYSISNIEIKKFSELEIINSENRHKKLFFDINSKFFMNRIKELLINDKLNEKGIYFILKLIKQLINIINKEDLLYILKFIWNFYERNKSEENNYLFMSFEYIEKVLNEYFELFNIKIENNEPFISIFNYTIYYNDSTSCYFIIKRNLEYINKNFKTKLNIPISIYASNAYKKKLKKIYFNQYNLQNISFYLSVEDISYETINENSILISKPILSDYDLLKISEILEKNKYKVRVIMVNNISHNIKENTLIDFINNNNVPIYLLENNIYQKMIELFIKGMGLKYIFIYDSNQYSDNNNDIFSVHSLELEKKLYCPFVPVINPIENILENLSKVELNKIKSIPNYKKSLCHYYKGGHCANGNNCDFAHGNEELKKIEKIRNYLNDDYKIEKEKKLEIYKANSDNAIKSIKNESKNIFNILNIKLCQKIILDILLQEVIQISDIENILGDIKNISDVYEFLCLEYYFNIENKISDALQKERLLKFFNKLISENNKTILENNWILINLKQIEKINGIDNNQNTFDIKLLNIKNLYNNEILLKKYSSCPNIIYEKLLFLIEIITKENKNENFIEYYYIIINKILIQITNYLDIKKTNQYDSGHLLEVLLLLKIINILYNYYCNKLANKSEDNKINDIFNIPNNIDSSIEKLMTINIDECFKNSGNNQRKKMKKQMAFLIEFIFKYFDICLILFYKNKQTKFFNYMKKKMFNHEDKFFKYYLLYKMITVDKNYQVNDYKVTMALIYYLMNTIITEPIHFEMIPDKINEFKLNKLNNGDELYDLDININEKEKKDFSNCGKIVIFCLDDKNQKYYFQDIIDLTQLYTYNDSYKLRVNKNIHLVPLKNINTYLYSIENIDKLIIKENNQSMKFTKYEDTPKYSWHIGYDGNKYLLLSEENNQIYNFIEQNNYCDLIKGNYNVDKRFENINKENNKIINFINGTGNYSSFAITQNYNIFLLNENRIPHKWLNEIGKKGIEYPITLNDIKISYISANYNSCYAIGKNGNLYENNGENFKKISPPKNTKKFLQCSCDDVNVYCLVQNNEGKGNLYAKGIKKNNKCGINNINDDVSKVISQNENLDYISICAYQGFLAAVTSCGKLFVWGRIIGKNNKYFISPQLINRNEDNSILIDKISLNYEHLYAIGRKLENGNYVKKLFYLKITNDKFTYNLKEINIIDKEDNNSRIIPTKILIGKKRTYFLCINENKIIEEIIRNSEKTLNDKKIKISIKYKETSIEKMQNIYHSDNLNKFINLYNTLSEKNIQNFIKNIERMKISNNIKTDDISYNELIVYLKDKPELNDLLSFFSDKNKNECKILFNYLKKRINLIEENIIYYLNINNSLETKGFIQTIIERNINYLNDDFRVQYFYTILLNMGIRDNFNIHHSNRRAITIDRFKATNFKEKYNEKKIPDIHLTETIFGQLFQIIGNLTGTEFLKDKGEKLFIVNLKGERAIDQGGPYSEILSNICDDLQSDYVELFIKTPNNKNEIGELRDRYIINPNADNINYKKAFKFIGKLMILAISSGETLNLNLHPIIWKSLLENKINFKEYETIDKNFFVMIETLKNGLTQKDKDLIDSLDLNFVIKNSNEKDIELIENGQNIKVTLENVELYINLAESKRIEEINEQIKYIKEGLYSGIGKNILQILNWNQLETMVCGEAIFDIEDFKKHTKCDNNNRVVQWFWEWLGNCKEEDKFKYLRFVSGKSRLPNKEYYHTIELKSFDKNQLPKSHTCFSILHLPEYDSKDILYKNMKIAISNLENIIDEPENLNNH